MRKILLTILFLTLCSTAHATVWYACTSGGNWSANVWTSVSADQGTCLAALGTPVAGDTATLNSSSGNITITSAAAAAFLDMTGYTGTLAVGSQTLTLTTGANLGGAMTGTGIILNSGGTITLLSTATGTFPSIDISGSQTLTSGGFTWPGKLVFNSGTPTVTLNGNWINSGLVTSSSATTLNLTTSETFTANGGITMTSTLSGSASVILGGGTWSGVGSVSNNMTLAGNSTISGTVVFKTGTLTYSSGTITLTGSSLNLSGNCTLNSNGLVWNNILIASGITITLTSALSDTGTLQTTNSTGFTFSGAFNISTAIFYVFPQGFTSTCNFVAGQTLTVTSALNLAGLSTSDTIGSVVIKSATASSATFLKYTGTLANEYSTATAYTDVTASGLTIYNYNGSTLTRTSNIINGGAQNLYHGQGYAY